MAIDQINEAQVMSAAIAIFVKTPSISPVKTRLAKTIGKEKALEFFYLSLAAVKETVIQSDLKAHWAVAEEEGLNDPLWEDFVSLYTGERGLGERQHHIYSVLKKRYAKVILIAADAPQISANSLTQAVSMLDEKEFVIGPARDGGYYLFGGRRPIPKEAWISVEYSKPLTRQHLEAALPSKPAYLPILSDVDTQDDLKLIVEEMPEFLTITQKKICDWIGSNL